MDAAADRPEFAPPPEPALVRAFVLAVLAHLLMLFALIGLKWQSDSKQAVAEAELWSAMPQQAAPKEEPVPPPPPPAPPQPVVKAPPVPEPPVNRDADIALEREKQKREQAKRLAEEREEQRRQLEAKKKREEELAKKREEELAKKKREEELAKKKQQEQQQKQLAEAKRKEDEKKRKEQEAKETREAKVREQLREEAIKRNMAMAGTGAPTSTGTAAQSSGASSGYAGRIAAIIKRNTHFLDTVAGDPPVEVEVRLSPDGTIVGRRVVKSSGNKARDEAVLRGIDMTERLPRDTDGRIHTPLIISVRQFG